jgi:hypothetical protein
MKARPSAPHSPPEPGSSRPKSRAASTPAAHLPPDEKRQHRLKDELLEQYKSPTTGRNTALGKKVEKPADVRPGGPSGQKHGAKDRKHANK